MNMGQNGHGLKWLWAEMTSDPRSLCETGGSLQCMHQPCKKGPYGNGYSKAFKSTYSVSAMESGGGGGGGGGRL